MRGQFKGDRLAARLANPAYRPSRRLSTVIPAYAGIPTVLPKTGRRPRNRHSRVSGNPAVACQDCGIIR